MAMNGGKFLQVTRARRFAVAEHALRRIEEHTGCPLDEEEACEEFAQAQKLSADQLHQLGYRPDSHRRRRRGVVSHYFVFLINDCELVAVVQADEDARLYTWITTYVANRQTRHFRMLPLERVCSAA